MTQNYVKAQSFNSAIVSDGFWYAMEAEDLDDIKANEIVNFGDKAYVIKDKTFHVFGNDREWYDA